MQGSRKDTPLMTLRRFIDKKVSEWQNGDMAKYLRPETLFGTKFDGYLNQPIAKKTRLCVRR